MSSVRVTTREKTVISLGIWGVAHAPSLTYLRMREESVCLAVVLAIFWVAPRSCTSFSLSSSKFAEAAAPAARLRSGRMQSCGALSVGAGANNVEEGFAWDPQEAQRLRSLLDGEKQFYEFAKGIKIGVTRTASEGINKLHRGQVEGAGVNLDLARKCLTVG